MQLGLCCSPLQRAFAHRLKERLERNLGIATLIIDDPAPVSSTWDQATASDAVLLLFDSASAPGPVTRRDWESLLEHDDSPPVALVRLEPCQYPKLLERRRFLAAADALEAERWAERWLAPMLPRLEHTFNPAPSTAAIPDEWWTGLVDQAGSTCIARACDADAAQAFARAAGGHFEGVHWIGCENRRAPAIQREIEFRTRGARRLLLILVHAGALLPELPGGHHSVLVLQGAPEAAAAPASNEPFAQWIGVCQPSGFPGALMDLMLGERQTAWESMVTLLDCERRLYRSRVQFPTTREVQDRHLFVIAEAFRTWRLQTLLCRDLVGEAVAAVRYGFRCSSPAARQLCLDLALFLLAEKRNADAVAWLRLLAEEAEGEDDQAMAQRARHELSWLVDDAGEVRPNVEVGEQLTLNFF